jgi:hypothetical protein
MKAVIVTISGIFVLLLSSTTFPAGGAASVNIFGPETKPYGLSYEDHIKNFWKYITSVPADKNPWNDKTGENCAVGQSGTNSSVFYLSGNGGDKFNLTCKIPAGKGLFIPVSPMEISDKEAPNTSIEDLHRIAKKDQDSVTSLYLKIGDKAFNAEDLKKYRKPTGDFQVVFDKNSVFGTTGGNSSAVADGYYVITEPLQKGNYVITYKSSLVCPGVDCLQPNFAQDMTYNVIVE